MRKLKPVPTSAHGDKEIFLHKSLEDCTHVFVRKDHVLKPLQSSFSGPFQVVSKATKTYKVKMNGKTQTISLDRIKPAFVSTDLEIPKEAPVPSPQEPIYRTRSGRQVRFPKKLTY